MSSTTKRWMRDELKRLVEQRDRYAIAEATTRDPVLVRRRTQRLAVIDEEILGRREALRYLTASHRRVPTSSLRPIGASLAVMQPRFGVTLAKTVGSSFAVGFALTAALLWTTGVGMPTTPIATARAVVPTANAPARVEQRAPIDTEVLAATARARR